MQTALNKLIFTSVFSVFSVVNVSTATVVPYTEMFATDNANWGGGGDWTTFDPLAWTAPGDGPVAGAGYVTNTQNFFNASVGGFPAITIFRGQDNYNSSGGAFVGNWIDSNIVNFSFWVRHDAPEDLEYSIRFTPAGANSPSMNFIFSELAQSGQWTQYTLDISPTTPGWIVGGGPSTYNTVFSNLGKIQIGVNPNPLTELDQAYNFDLSMVAIPAPGTLALLALAGLGGRRRRTA